MSIADNLTQSEDLPEDLQFLMNELGAAARAAALTLTNVTAAAKNTALRAAAKALRDNQAGILAANKEDMAAAGQRGLSGPMLDRLALDPDRVEAMAVGLEAIAVLDDPVGSVIADWERPNGLRISRVRTPLGVIGVIYESRPNVTADAGALCLKAGNAAILRGGSESYNSVRAIHDCLVQGLREAGLPEAAIQLLPTRDRAAVGMLLAMPQYVDVIVPRGGKSLIERVQNEAKMPVFAHLEGICHIYVDGAADLEKALAITLNAKLRRTSICGAAECLLVDQAVAASHLPKLLDALIQAGCEVRGDEQVQTADARVVPAVANDWGREYLDAIIACKVVDGVGGAVAHIAEFGSSHTDSIITEDAVAAERFLNEVDSAIVMHNVSTQFGDGGEFGMGAEIGIATGRMHARGPIGVDQLTTFKYIVRGDGQIRP